MKKRLFAMALCAVLSAGTVMSALPAAAAEASEQVLNVYKNNEPATLDRTASTID